MKKQEETTTGKTPPSEMIRIIRAAQKLKQEIGAEKYDAIEDEIKRTTDLTKSP